MRARRAARRETPLVLTPAQQEFLALHGFGPTAPPTDFDDPEVRTRFVGLLRECGALAPAPHAPASAVHSDIARAG
jgi:hypothetical protein